MINGKLLKPTDAIYHHVDDKGRNTFIHSERLREWVLKTKPEIVLSPVDPNLMIRFLEDKSYSEERVRELANREKLDPIIYCATGTYTDGRPDVFLADGHHRYVLACVRGLMHIQSHLIAKRDWRQFRIYNLPKLTQEALASSPILKRNY